MMTTKEKIVLTEEDRTFLIKIRNLGQLQMFGGIYHLQKEFNYSVEIAEEKYNQFLSELEE